VPHRHFCGSPRRRHQLGAFGRGDRHVLEVLRELLIVDHGTDVGALLAPVVELQRLHLFRHCSDEAVVDAFSDDQPRGGRRAGRWRRSRCSTPRSPRRPGRRCRAPPSDSCRPSPAGTWPPRDTGLRDAIAGGHQAGEADRVGAFVVQRHLAHFGAGGPSPVEHFRGQAHAAQDIGDGPGAAGHEIGRRAGLSTTALPQARAGAVFQARSAMGKFQGVIRPAAPVGPRVTSTPTPGRAEGTTSHPTGRASPAKNSKMLPAMLPRRWPRAWSCLPCGRAGRPVRPCAPGSRRRRRRGCRSAVAGWTGPRRCGGGLPGRGRVGLCELAIDVRVFKGLMSRETRGPSTHPPPIRLLNIVCLLLTGLLEHRFVIGVDATRGLVRWLWSFRAPRTMPGNIARVTPSWAKPVGKPSPFSHGARGRPHLGTRRPGPSPCHAVELVLLAHRRGRLVETITVGRNIAFSVP